MMISAHRVFYIYLVAITGILCTTGTWGAKKNRSVGNPEDLKLLNWKIHETAYPTTDIVVAGCNILDFGAVGDGKKDCTGAFRRALQAMYEIGGGTIFIPSGQYVIKGNLEVPVSVTLRGEWKKPEKSKKVEGTVLMAYAGRGQEDGTPFISVNVCGGVKDLSVWYPEQEADHIVPYPFTFFQKRGNNATFENITLVNSYQGIRIGPGGNELHYVHNLFGTPLKVGVWYDSTTDIGRLEHIYFSPDYWSGSGLAGSPQKDGAHKKWIYENGTGLHMFRSDWEYVSYIKVHGYSRGLHVSQGERGAANAQFYLMKMSGCKVALDIEKTNPYGMVFTKCMFTGDEYGIQMSPAFDSVAMFASCTISGGEAVKSEGTGNLMFQQCSFKSGNVEMNGGTIVLSSCRFSKTSQEIKLGEHVRGASLTDLRGNPKMVNNADVNILSKSSRAVLIEPLPKYRADNDRVHKPGKAELYNVMDEKWGARADGKTDDTQSIQRAMQQAATLGGGIVFLPAGNYVIKGRLKIPGNVELRGIHDVPHHTVGNGSILHIYPPDNKPTLVLNDGSGMRGLAFNYPEQSISRVREYPFLIQGNGGDIYIIDVNCANPYKFLDLKSKRCDNHYVDYLSGSPLRVGIEVGGGAKDGQIRNMQFNPHYWNRCDRKNPLFSNAPKGGVSQGTGKALWTYQKDNMDALTIGDTVDQFLFQNFVFGSLYGISFTSENGRGPKNCVVHGHGTDGSKIGLYFKSSDAAIWMINTELVAMASTDKTAIKLAPEFTGKAMLFNTMIWGQPDLLAEVDNGELLIQGGCIHNHGQGIKINNGKVHAINLSFAKEGNNLSISKKGTAEISGCITPAGLIVDGVVIAEDVKREGLVLFGNIQHGKTKGRKKSPKKKKSKD